jgi:hypothetical protein
MRSTHTSRTRTIAAALTSLALLSGVVAVASHHAPTAAHADGEIIRFPTTDPPILIDVPGTHIDDMDWTIEPEEEEGPHGGGEPAPAPEPSTEKPDQEEQPKAA